jgi:hypothetical protein
MSGNKYVKLTASSIKGDILLAIRDQHVTEIARQLLTKDVIPLNYLDDKIKLDSLRLKKDPVYTYENRLKYLINILKKQCSQGTSTLIAEICTN